MRIHRSPIKTTSPMLIPPIITPPGSSKQHHCNARRSIYWDRLRNLCRQGQKAALRDEFNGASTSAQGSGPGGRAQTATRVTIRLSPGSRRAAQQQAAAAAAAALARSPPSPPQPVQPRRPDWAAAAQGLTNHGLGQISRGTGAGTGAGASGSSAGAAAKPAVHATQAAHQVCKLKELPDPATNRDCLELGTITLECKVGGCLCVGVRACVIMHMCLYSFVFVFVCTRICACMLAWACSP